MKEQSPDEDTRRHVFIRTLHTKTAVMAMVMIAVLAGCTGGGSDRNKPAEVSAIKAGVAETIITPPVGTPMRGYRRLDVSKGVHDDLHARSLVIEGTGGDDQTTVVLMTLSLANLDHAFMNRIRAGVTEKTGIPGDNIVISCTHTHSGPMVRDAESDYQELLLERSVESAVSAWNNRVPARIGTGTTEVTELGRNDRRLGYGGLHPDPEVGIIKVEDTRGGLMGVAFIYGCHPSTLDLHNLDFTEDWPYYAIRGIRETVGDDVWVAYFQSAQGDIKVGYTAELSAVGAEMPVRSFRYAEVKGNQMVDAVLEALPEIAPAGDSLVGVVNGFFDYPLRTSCPVSLAEARQQEREANERLAEREKNAPILGKRVIDQAKVDVFLAELMVGWAQWIQDNPDPAPISMRQQAILIGDAALVTFPVEVFSEIGLKVKQQSPYDKTFVIGIAGGHGGYLPTKEEFLEGGYAVLTSRYAPECEQVCIDASLELIERLSR